jgi:signal transduction histidine kinase
VFRRARLRLSLSYAALTFALLSLLIVAAYLALVLTIDQQIDDDLEESAIQLRSEVGSPEFPSPVREVQSSSVVAPRSFVLALAEDGGVISNPRNVARVDLLSEFFERVLAADGEIRDEIVIGRVRYRLYGAALEGEAGMRAAIVSGRDLAFRDERVRLAAMVLGSAAGVGLLLSFGIGWWIAGRAIAPMARAYEMQQQFVADASHELRAPVTVIRTAADLLLRDEDLEEDHRESVADIRETAVDAGLLLDEMLTLARLSDVTAVSETDLVDLAEIAAGELARMRPALEEHDVRIRTMLEPAPASAGPRECARIVRALLENVIRHTPSGTRLMVSAGVRDEQSFAAIDDDGPGVPPGQHGTIFGRFAEVSTVRTPIKEGGSGLGLAIVDAIATRYGGVATASRSPMGGLRIKVAFPSA